MRQDFDEFGRGYWLCPDLDKKRSSGDTEGPDTEKRDPATKEEANLLSSQCFDGQHRPVIDIDIPVRYIESTTPGHGHLYIDKPMEWGVYTVLLRALVKAGIVEYGYAEAAIRRGASFVRPPGVKKPPKEEVKKGPFGTVRTVTPAADRKPPAFEPPPGFFGGISVDDDDE